MSARQLTRATGRILSLLGALSFVVWFITELTFYSDHQDIVQIEWMWISLTTCLIGLLVMFFEYTSDEWGSWVEGFFSWITGK